MAQGLYDISPLEPLVSAGCVLLTPNLRLARRIKAEWDTRRVAAGEGTWEQLKVQPLESWLLQQWELAVSSGLLPPVTPLSSAQALDLWRQVINQHEAQSTEFHLLRPAAAAEIAQQARDTLIRWQVGMNDGVIRQLFRLDRDCATFLTWLDLFEARLADAGQCTLVDCVAQLVLAGNHLPAVPVALIQFEDTPPLLRSALGVLSSEIREFSPSAVAGERMLHALDDRRAELQAVANWAAELHRGSPEATIGIVLSDMGIDRVTLEYLLRREFDCLGAGYNSLPVNFSTGITLAQAPVVRDALSVLSMGLQQASVASVVNLLHSPFVALPDAQSALAQYFIKHLYQQGQEVLSLSALRIDASSISLGSERGLVLGEYLFDLYEKRELRTSGSPSQWAQRFGDVLFLWGWPGPRTLDSLEFQQLELWYRTLDEFRTFDAVCNSIHYADALQLLRDCCRRQVSQPQTADSPVQVLGPLEAAGLTFEHMWICGMQSTKWPVPARPNPLIPVSLQTQLLMPHATPEREWAYSNNLLKQYQQSCSMLHASFSRQIDGVPELPSALLQEFTVQSVPDLPALPRSWIDNMSKDGIEEIPDHIGPPVVPDQLPLVKGGSGLLENQSQCPFRAFAHHRLLVEPLADFTLTLSPADRGSLLHAALCALWGEIKDHETLSGLDDSQRQAVVAAAAESAISTMSEARRRKLGRAYWRLEGLRLQSLLQEWLVVELQRSAFSVAHREQDITVQLKQLSIRLRVDRVDQLPDGSRVIIDYKSGKCSVKDWLGERPAKPQLLLYAIAGEEEAAALAFAQVQPRNCRYVGLGRVEAAPGVNTDISRATSATMKTDDWQSLNSRWRQHLARIAQAFIDGEAAVDPLAPASCTWCGLQPLCRVDVPLENEDAKSE